VWLWGDTLIGTLEKTPSGSYRRNIAGMPRNSVSVQYVSTTAISPMNFTIKFDPTKKLNSGFFSPTNLSRWYWPVTGVETSELGIVISAYEVTGDHDGEGFAFSFTQSVLITVRENFLLTPPSQWKWTATPIPNSNEVHIFISAPSSPSPFPLFPPPFWHILSNILYS